ncbi:MAG: hypothetical protein AUK07_00405 [Parcubacteria group bacterium CG2_30_36_21]|uniref:DUF4129 domain-containing protein n=3 Tax=Candidatus Gribaldobacteria TaxID=2798536 RepID=A0A2M7VK71_9BACT|nr:MAG: hypothetical protein AUK07_00405 [Parcubacteria group bacterium CG2_30_36_21]PIR91498.1 MAG: hypothetical protein COU02_00155 [bacterium (Candidatus Gribaldobacteria) CG10_big_fil_rev_8_21_14_0_10_37_46]PIV14153.1 MAG: hypothetical protein COS44_00475 [bacterium (Candidatus Gribaldobacteria) CG03_land_8_20_14_0_80_36_40]PJA02203.1 MAG: hypothetical protein COX73_01980 [bacterium (Candidatus Gribaldobacteria) CG_4_10_14_0_2_um_filter_36_18]
MYLEGEGFNKFTQSFESAFDILVSPQLQEKIFIFKIIFIIISIIFFAMIVYYALNTTYLRRLFIQDLEDASSWKDYGRSKIFKKWQKIKKRLKKDNEAEYKLALIEAGKILDDILKKMGYGEKSLSDKLRHLSSSHVSNLEELLKVNEICQNVIRDPDYKLNKEKAEEIINILEKSLKDLEAF